MKKQAFKQKDETRQCKMIFPGTLNSNKILFGGALMLRSEKFCE
jgi:acyl-CoA hydrolase